MRQRMRNCLSPKTVVGIFLATVFGVFPAGAAYAATIDNTATASYQLFLTDPPIPQSSNTTELVTVPPPTPATVTFYQYAPPGTPSDVQYPVDGGAYDNGTAVFLPLPDPITLGGQPIALDGPVPLRETAVFHAGEPVFVSLADTNRNQDSSLREFIELTITSSTGDVEILRLQETGPDTGVFAAVIQSADPSEPVTQYDGRLSVGIEQTLVADYQDLFYPTDQAQDRALVDPYGTVFDSGTGVPVNGVTITVINADTGLPARVFGDDGVSSFPSTIVTGGTHTDSSGRIYQLPPGEYRFPYLLPGNYRYLITAPAGFTVPSTVPQALLPNDPDGFPYAIADGSYGEVFAVLPGPALLIDIPIDPPPLNSSLFLQKSVSATEASAGDFLRYALSLQNRDTANAATSVTITDTLPRGLRYEAGSLRVNGVAIADPVIAADGRTLTMAIGAVAASGKVEISYVVRVIAFDAQREAVNRAQAAADGGLRSNVAQVAVKLREPLMSNGATIIGRVLESPCDTPQDKLKGVPDVRLVTEDGTYVATDRDGMYHLEGVRPGTHVVQIDLASLPKGWEPVSCIANTRFAGRSYSQFVEVQGGTLWRADFYLRPVTQAVNATEAGVRLQTFRDELSTSPVASPTPVTRQYTFRGKFASGQDELLPESVVELRRLLKELKSGTVERLEIVGHTDSQRLSLNAQKKFADNYGLSLARANTLAKVLGRGLGLDAQQIHIDGKGADVPVAGNATPEDMAMNRRVEVIVQGAAPTESASTSDDGRRRHRLDIDTGNIPATNPRATVMLPPGMSYVPDSSTLDGITIADPEDRDGALVWKLPAAGAGWQHRLEFLTLTKVMHKEAAGEMRSYTFHGQFASGEAELLLESYAELARLLRELDRGVVERMDIIAHTDSEPLSPQARAKFTDNQGLSQARANVIAELLGNSLGLDPSHITAIGKGADMPVASNKTSADRAQNRRVEVIVHGRDVVAVSACAQGGYLRLPAMVTVDTDAVPNLRLPVVENRVTCNTAAATAAGGGDHASDLDSGRKVAVLKAAAQESAPVIPAAGDAQDVDGVSAAGGSTDWLAQATSGIDWLFPGTDYNPRAPSARVVIQHEAGQKVQLSVNGEPASPLNFDGVRTDKSRNVAVSVWRGLALREGDNRLAVQVLDSEGNVVKEMARTVHYGNAVARAELVPERSVLVADGMQHPRIAVRLLDRDGKPVRAGVSTTYQVGAPYMPWQSIQNQQDRQLAGMDRFQPQLVVQTDDGIGFVELQPTTESGELKLNFSFQLNDQQSRRQELRTWLTATPRDWIMVGFVEGTVGYETLNRNITPLPDSVEDGGYSDGQASFYAKGRISGQWLATIAYDSGKASKDARRDSLLSTIDPNEFYTLYGDGSEQRYDAPSQSKLYLKIERNQFYALFGDYETGLTVTELARYNRTLNGFKAGKGGGPVNFTVFAAQTAQNSGRDEIRGNGTSGLYQLSRPDIVINSEKIRIETRDRYQSQIIVQSRSLTRHLDYDIDYAAGTLFFREPIVGRDVSFNPVFIVAEFETMGNGIEDTTAGGRVGTTLAAGRVEAGLTAISERQYNADTELVAVDATLHINDNADVRVEAADSSGTQGLFDRSGAAMLVEYEHHTPKVDGLVYVRRQEPGFGLSQQGISESGMQKIGADGQLNLDEHWALRGELYRQENLVSAAARDVANGGVRWQDDVTKLDAGLQVAQDDTGAGENLDSEQLTLGASHLLMDKRLELTAQSDIGLGNNSNENPDFPTRLQFGAAYAITPAARLIAAQEFTDGADYNTSLTRAGVQVVPWQGSRLETTLNQQAISEYGPRTFAQFGLTQALLVGEQWSADASLDSSRTLAESGFSAALLNPNQPSAVAGGETITDDYVALSAGLTYREALFTWNGRVETRHASTSDRNGIVTHLLREANAGIAFAADAQYFIVDRATGMSGRNGKLGFAWAWRPLGWHWSLLDRLEFKYDALENGTASDPAGLFGYTSLNGVGDAASRRIINNFALNRVSRAWNSMDRQGNLFHLNQRNQWSLYYGSKYAMDRIDGTDYSGYTDMLGVEVRHDLTRHWDIGFQASALHAWEPGTVQYSFGPSVGWSPLTNAWISVGYNVKGFDDPDFADARYTAQGLFLKVRFKFDQKTRLHDHEAPRYEIVPAPVGAAIPAEDSRP